MNSFGGDAHGLKMKPTIEEYLTQCSPAELQAIEIAKRLLGSSYDMKKSNGFMAYCARCRGE